MMQKSICFALRGFVLIGLATSLASNAAQTVDPRLTVAGATIASTTQTVPAGTTFTFYGVYSDDSVVTGTNTTGAESGLGLKVKYNGTHLTNVIIDEQYTKCRIAAAQYPASNSPPTAPTATDQAVMGWIDTAIRPTGVASSANGSVGWPDLIDQASTGQCLNPGNINTDTAAVAPSGLKLFKFTATMAAGCTSAAACTSAVTFDSEGNFSYASATPGMATQTFNIAGAAAPTIALVFGGSRRTHGVTGTFDVAVSSINAGAAVAAVAADTSISIESRAPLAGAAYTTVMDFNAAVTSGTATVQSCIFWNGTASQACVTNPTVGAVTFSGTTATIPLSGVTNQSRVLVRLASVNGQAYNAEMAIGFLIGDVTASRAVNGTDASQVSLRSGQAVTAINARYDITGNGGTINGTDASQASLRSGTRLP